MQFVHHSHIVHSHALNHQVIARAGEYKTAIHPTTNANKTEQSRSLLMIAPFMPFGVQRQRRFWLNTGPWSGGNPYMWRARSCISA